MICIWWIAHCVWLSGDLLLSPLPSAPGQVSLLVLLIQSQSDATSQPISCELCCWWKQLIQKYFVLLLQRSMTDLYNLISQPLRFSPIRSIFCFMLCSGMIDESNESADAALIFSDNTERKKKEKVAWLLYLITKYIYMSTVYKTCYTPDRLPFSCFLRWRSRLVCWPKQRSHRWHLNGFSLLWMLRMWRCKLEEMLKERSQYLHLQKESKCLSFSSVIKWRKHQNAHAAGHKYNCTA